MRNQKTGDYVGPPDAFAYLQFIVHRFGGFDATLDQRNVSDPDQRLHSRQTQVILAPRLHRCRPKTTTQLIFTKPEKQKMRLIGIQVITHHYFASSQHSFSICNTSSNSLSAHAPTAARNETRKEEKTHTDK